MTERIRILLGVLVGVAAMLSYAPLLEAQTRILAVNDIEENSVKGQSFELFKKLVMDKLENKVRVEVSHGEALYNQKTLIQAMQLNAVQISAPGIGLYSGAFPKVTVMALPYLLPSPAAIREAADDPSIGGALFNEIRQKGIEPLAIWLNGPREIGWTGDKPILLPEDIKGKKIRVAPGDVYVETFKLLGANVTTMAWGGVPTALRTGVIDAVEPTPNAWVGSHMYEIAKQITKTAYIWDFYIVSANRMWWTGMAPNQRKVIQEALDEATRWNWANTNAENAKAFEIMAAAGATTTDLTADQKQAWAKAVRPLWDDLGNKLVGAEVMRSLIAVGDRHRGERLD